MFEEKSQVFFFVEKIQIKSAKFTQRKRIKNLEKCRNEKQENLFGMQIRI